MTLIVILLLLFRELNNVQRTGKNKDWASENK